MAGFIEEVQHTIIRNALLWYKINIFTININAFHVVKNYMKVCKILNVHEIVSYVSHNLPLLKND